MRNRFAQINTDLRPAPRSKHTLLNLVKADLEREKQVLDEVLASAATGGIVVVPQLKPAVEALLGKTMALSTLYRRLARYGWRKLTPDTKYPQSDQEAREEWEKNFQTNWR